MAPVSASESARILAGLRNKNLLLTFTFIQA
jgi:hypothetical protein